MKSGAAPLLIAALVGGAALALSRPAPKRRRERTVRVVVVGAGFGGLNAAMRLAGRPGVDLTVIDSHNHHLFQPLLYQTATAALAPSDIATPLRGILHPGERTRVLLGTVTGVDTASREVVWDGGRLPYDELIVATGSVPSYFGHDDWARSAPGLKTLDDAIHLRRRILMAFERAAGAGKADRARLLTFVLIGAGPTGVEMAGAIAELAQDLLTHDYDLPGAKARIVLIEAGDHVLPEFSPDLRRNAANALRALGVEIRTGTRVTGIADGVIHVHEDTLDAETVIWTAGTAATPVAEWLGVKPAHGGRVAVRADLSVGDHPEIHVIGDAAHRQDRRGKPLPALAPVAKQQGKYVANAILRRLRGQRPQAAFAYSDYGTLATIGRGRAVAEIGPVHLTGLPAWAMWAGAHIFFLIGFRNRVLVGTEWALAYLTRQRTDRIISGPVEAVAPSHAASAVASS